MLRSHLVDAPKVVDRLLDFQGPLGTFSSRINLVYGLGLIREDQFEDLDTIRRIRNGFAHSHQPIGFSEQSLASLIGNLKQLAIMESFKDRMKPEVRELLIERFQTLREKFIGNALHLAIGLMVRGANIVHQEVGRAVDSEGSKLPFEGS